MKNLTQIRHNLHKIAEISGQEKLTSDFICNLLKDTEPDRIINNIGGYSLAAEYSGKSSAITIMLRADIDALPIPENNNFEYKSLNKNVSHKCGHDGHSTILIGLAQEMKKLINKLNCRVILLFQASEENGKGAELIINDEKFNYIRPDYIFGLHNLPNFPEGSIVIRNGIFASASKGLAVKLKGCISHAGHPENGNNPVLAMTNLINGLLTIPSLFTKLENSANITIIHAQLGEVAFGTSPGEAVVMATLRSHTNEDMELMTNKATSLIIGLAATYGLDYEIQWVDEFPATVNDSFCSEIISDAATQIGSNIIYQPFPFPWSEDFGRYCLQNKGAFLGLGAGNNCKQLHNPEYDFPDEIISTGIDIFKKIIELLAV